MFDMSDILRLFSDAGPAYKRLRTERKLSAVQACRLAGKSRDTLYRFESGEDTSLGTAMAFLATVGHALEVVKAGLPSIEEMRNRFGDGDGDDDD